MEITYCDGCHSMTKSIRKGRANYTCSTCGSDKNIGDLYQYELNQGVRQVKNGMKEEKE